MSEDRKSLRKRIVALSVPVMVAMMSQTAINQVDHILIGRLPPSQSIPGQAALGISLILLWAVGGFLSALATGTQALTARRLGAGEEREAGRVMFNALILGAVTSAVASIASWFVVPRIFPFFTRSEEVLALGVPYLQWRMLGVFSIVTTVAYKSWFDGLGRTRVHMGAAIVMNIINFVLNVALIFGRWGFPELGVVGSAIASMISSYVGLLLMVAWSFRKEFGQRFRNYALENFSSAQQLELARLSLPSGVATLFVMSGFGMFFKIVGLLDAVRGGAPIYTAATQNIIIVLMLLFTGCLAYGTATATLVGQSMGAKRNDLAERYGWEATKLGVLVGAILGLVMALAPDVVLNAFSRDAEVIAVAKPIFRICALLFPFIVAAIVFTQALFGAGNTKFVMFVEFGLHFFCLVPLAYLLGVTMGWGVMGVWTGAFIYIVLLACIMGWKFWEGRWKEIRI